ncbi:PREDICTED: uncharacterized protein LOC105313424 [Amphimedon queenslandica]|uniref:Inositol 1,4,5-trisphosphate/ryanodine receptor domain-containing protein n=1 Tax=Amphimedon queenslandica TaxID=400682 RepID=A0AAN0JC93_AMPQE|nr:PREDICTED: uncharacterized protein LOC105313424 [Amphimedon queenslandica]|eukprot:XP_019854318.1 PREDICTED: uncharacterized protein LOC105313424 [Amphimedon queenslandica]
MDQESDVFIREGDTILLSYEVKGEKSFLYSMQPIRSKDDEAYEALDKYAFNQPTLYPLAYDEIKKRAIPPNVHYLSFKIIPELSEKQFQDDAHDVRKDTDCDMKLVYGKKIKLLHVGSKMYLSLPQSSEEDKNITFRPVYDERTCLFIVHPPNEEKQLGDKVCSGDTIFLKSSSQPYYIVSNNKGDNKLSMSDSIGNSIGLTVYLHRSVKANADSIRGGSVVRLSCLETDAFLHGEGSTLDPSIWTRGLEHFRQEGLFKVGFTQKRKLPNGVHKPLPVSGDCYWLLEKWDKPLDGTSFQFGDKCSLRHLQTQRYLALNTAKEEFELIAVNGNRSQGYQYKFIIEPGTPDTDSSNQEVQQDSEIMLVADSKNVCLSLDTKKRPFRDSKKRQISTQWLKVKCSDLGDGDCVTRKKSIIKVGEVEKRSLFRLYFIESVKSILQEMLVPNPVALEEDDSTLDPNERTSACLHVLQCVSKWLKKGLSTTRKTRGKILRSSEVIALLVNSLCFVGSNEICSEIASILTDFIKIHSHRSHLYFIYRPQPCDMSLADVVVSQLKKDPGIQMILYHLLDRQSGVTDTVALSLLNSKFLDRITWPLTINDKTIIEIFAMLCTPNGIPFEEMQNYICTELKKRIKEIPLFIIEYDTLHYVEGGSVNPENFSDDTKVKINYFVALLEFFATLCKGGEKVSSDFVKKHCPFNTSCLNPSGLIDSVVNDSVLCNKLKSAYLKCIISAYIEPNIENSGIDIDNIWHCYLWSRVSPNEKTDETSRFLYASNVSGSILNELEP